MPHPHRTTKRPRLSTRRRYPRTRQISPESTNSHAIEDEFGCSDNYGETSGIYANSAATETINDELEST